MVFRALSNKAKRLKLRRTKDDADQEATVAAQAEATKPPGAVRRSIRGIAKAYQVTKSTLSRRLKGQRSISEYAAQRQKVKPAEERVLVDFIKESADRGFPLSHSRVEEMANTLIQEREGPDYEPVGKNWIYKFLAKYHDELQTHWSRPLDTQRAQGLNPEAVKKWFDLLEEQIVEKGVRPEDIYGMDESNFPRGLQGRSRVIGSRGTKTQHRQGGGSKENVTGLVTICADGTMEVDPMIIYKARHFMKKWGEDNIADATIAFSENGWTNGGLALLWMKKVFDPETREKAAGRVRVLLMDGHSSHYTYALLLYARENNIIILGYPPHCTHALQGLDVVCFARMKEIFKEEIRTFEEQHKREVTKGDFTGVFGRAYVKAFTFQATGVHPFNRDVITPAQMKPSVPTSVKGSFPLPQPSPVRATLAVFRHQPPTALDISESLYIPESVTATPSASTSRKRSIDPAIDPSLYTPSKRARLLYGALGATESGSYLVSNVTMTSSHTIHRPVLEAPPPLPTLDSTLLTSRASHQSTRSELELRTIRLEEELRLAHQHIKARDAIIEGNHAQMIIQNLTLEKQNQALYAKENPRKVDNSRLYAPDGFGLCLTSDEFMEAKRLQEERKEREAKEKAEREQARLTKKAQAELLEKRWQSMLQAHRVAVSAWEQECQTLRSQGVKVKNLPKKPARPSRAMLQGETEDSVDEEDAESGSETD